MPLLLAQQLPVVTEALPALTALPPPGQTLTEAPPAETEVPPDGRAGTMVKPALVWLPRLS